MRVLLPILAALCLSGCAVRQVNVQVPYDNELTARIMQPGTGSIRGSGLARQQGGGVVTCAGSQVLLFPATAYSTKFLLEYLGPGNLADEYRPLPLHLAATGFGEQMRTTHCDAQGFFKFDRVGLGDYFVQTIVTWQAGRRCCEGGTLTRKIAITGNDLVEITLAP